MKYTLTLISLLLFTANSTVLAQGTFNRVKYYFGDSISTLNSIQSLCKLDSSYYFGLAVIDHVMGQQIAVCKSDHCFQNPTCVLLEETGIDHPLYPGNSIMLDADSNIIVVSSRQSNAGTDGWIVKLNRNLDTLWTRVIDIPDTLTQHPSGTNAANYFTVIRLCRDGNYLLAGNFDYLPNNYDKPFLLKLDTAGNVLWWKTYPNYPRRIYDVELGHDNGYLFPIGTGTHFSLVKTDSIGEIQWQVQVNHHQLPSYPMDVLMVDSSTVIVASAHWIDHPNDVRGLTVACVNTLDQSLVWEKHYLMHRSFRSSGVHQSMSLEKHNDHVFVASTAFVDYRPWMYTFKGVLLKLNLQGDSIWSQFYHARGTYDYAQFNDMLIEDDGSFLLAGSYFEEFGHYQTGAWIVRADSTGYAPGSHTMLGFQDNPPEQSMLLDIYPNPTYNKVKINLDHPCSGILTVLNLSGQKIESYKVKSQSVIELDLQGLRSGHYLLRFEGDDGSIRMGKMVKL